MIQLDQIILAFNEYKLTHSKVNCPFTPICVYKDFLREQGYYEISEWDPNGWEVEFWNDYYNPETKDWVTLNGSLYYGDFNFNYGTYDYDEETIKYIIEHEV